MLEPSEDVPFLRREDVPQSLKTSSLEYLLSLTATGSGGGFSSVLKNRDCVTSIIYLAMRENCAEHCEIAHKCLINMSAARSDNMMLVVENRDEFYRWIVGGIASQNSSYVSYKCQILSNLTQAINECVIFVEFLYESADYFKNMMFHFNSGNNVERQIYSYLALLFGNMSRLSQGRMLFVDREMPYIRYLLPCTTDANSEIRKIGSAIFLKNICFETHLHQFLLNEVDILPSLLLPLGGSEEFSEDEMDKLPIELQYLGNGHQREPNAAIRITLLEALFKLCVTKYGREHLRNKGVYYILRELHKWEINQHVKEACENVINILIIQEPEREIESLDDVTIPHQIREQFERAERRGQSEYQDADLAQQFGRVEITSLGEFHDIMLPD